MVCRARLLIVPAAAFAGERQLVVLDYSAAWCGPCRMMEPVLAGWARELSPRVVFVKCDCEEFGNRQLAASSGVRFV